MTDKEQSKEQLKGGDHIPTDTTEEEQNNTGSGGLLSKIGDPVGTFVPPFNPRIHHCHQTLISSALSPSVMRTDMP